MRFELKAIAPAGNVEAVDFQAPDETTARRSLEGRGYTVLSVRAKRSLGLPWRSAAERFPRRWRRRSGATTFAPCSSASPR